MTSVKSNYLKNIAIVGAGGNAGSPIAKALLATGRFTITALTRPESISALPVGLNVIKVSYDDSIGLTNALRGQDALIITLGVVAAHEQQPKLITAAANAGVPWILPNEWSPDTTCDSPESTAFHDDLGLDKKRFLDLIRSLGKSNYIAVTTGFWYEWSLHIAPEAAGFDWEKKEVTFYDQGETKISMSTFTQVGRAAAALLSLPIQPESESERAQGRFLENFADKHIYVASFTVSQKDIFNSVLRVTGDSPEAWKVKNIAVKERYDEGAAMYKNGELRGHIQQLYARSFYPDGFGNHEKTRGLANRTLGLLEENIDEATAKSFQKSLIVNFAL